MPLTKEEARKFDLAKSLWEKAKCDEAYEIVGPVLLDNPYNGAFLALAGVIYEKAENLPVAYHFFKSASQIEPNEANHWVNLGRVAEDMWRTQDAERYYKIALKKVKRDDTLRILLVEHHIIMTSFFVMVFAEGITCPQPDHSWKTF